MKYNFIPAFAIVLLLSSAAGAQEEGETPATPAVDPMLEFANVPPGLMMPPAAPAEPEEPPPEEEVLGAHGTLGFLPPVEEARSAVMTMDEITKEFGAGNFAKILPSLQMLTKNKHRGAQELLGIMYKNGQGVAKDPKRAFELLSEAAESGRPLAEHHLAVMYFLGEGTEKADLVRSLMWLQIAIVYYTDGPEKKRALQDQNSVLVRMSRREKERATEMAREWLDKRGEAHLLDMR